MNLLPHCTPHWILFFTDHTRSFVVSDSLLYSANLLAIVHI